MKRYIIIGCLGVGMLFTCQSCRREEKSRAEVLCRELKNSTLLTPVTDSLINEAVALSKFLRAKVLLVAGSRYGKNLDQMLQSRKYLEEAMRIAPRNIKNEVTLELARLYGSLILRYDCAEDGIYFMNLVRSKVVFTREEEAEFYYLKAKFFKSVNLERAFSAIDQALSMFQGLHDARGEIKTYCMKAAFYGILEEYQQQCRCYEEAYGLLKRIGGEEVEPFFEQMAGTLKKLGRYGEALVWYGEALKGVKDPTRMLYYDIQVAEVHSGLGNHGKAREILKRGLAGERREGVRGTLLGRIADSFLAEEKRDSALVYLDSTIRLYERFAREKNLKVSGVMFMNYLQYARCLWDTGRPEAAIEHLEKVGRLTAAIPENIVSQLKAMEQLCDYYEALGRKPEFYDAYRRHDSLVEVYQSSLADSRCLAVLEKYKNQKLLQEIEEMNQKKSNTNWWLVLSLVMTIGLVTVALVYTWISWEKQIEERHKNGEKQEN